MVKEMRNFMEIVLRFWLALSIPQGALRSRRWKETLSWDARVECVVPSSKSCCGKPKTERLFY